MPEQTLRELQQRGHRHVDPRRAAWVDGGTRADDFAVLGTAGSLRADARLATLALGQGYTLVGTATAFASLPGPKRFNPLEVPGNCWTMA